MKKLTTTQLLTILILSLITFSSCKKEEVTECEADTQLAITTNDYFPISVGSYWVYEFRMHQVTGEISPNSSLDTLKVTGDTLIDGETYFVFNTNKPTQNTNYYRRVNQGEIVSETGVLVCPPDNSYTGIYNSYYDISGADTARHSWEEFSGYEMVSTTFGPAYSSIQKTINHKTWPTLGGNTFADTIYYSPIGILQRSFSYFTGGKQVGTLVDYNIE
jgi:hypothetical protein